MPCGDQSTYKLLSRCERPSTKDFKTQLGQILWWGRFLGCAGLDEIQENLEFYFFVVVVIILLSFQKMFRSVIFRVTQLLASQKWWIRAIQRCYFVYLCEQFTPCILSVLFTTGNTVINNFKHNQNREFIPEVPELSQKINPKNFVHLEPLLVTKSVLEFPR